MLAVAGLTVTLATGTVVTVTVAVPLLPSLVAVIVAEPAATPVTSPVPLTVATPGAPLAQETVRPASGAPVESSGVAVSCTVCPTASVLAAGVTTTRATGTGLTAIVAVSATLPALAITR